MRFAVETWSPEYGSSIDDSGLETTTAPVDPDIEVAAARWAPVDVAPATRTEALLFIDGVRRVDARVWIDDGNGAAVPGLCATVAAGAVRCERDESHLVAAQLSRGVYAAGAVLAPIATRAGVYEPCLVVDGAPEALILGVQERMAALEIAVATHAEPAELTIVDGPLRGRQQVPGAVGYIKTQHVRYLPDPLDRVVAALAPGQRTPLFAIAGQYTRISWYLRLPCRPVHPLAGIVRCEIDGHRAPADAVAIADRVAALLPAFASEPHKDARSPQNLYPIAGLERELRRRLGDPAFVERSLRLAAAR